MGTELAALEMPHLPSWLRVFLEWSRSASDLVGLVIIVIGLGVGSLRWILAEGALLRRRGDGEERGTRLHEVRAFLGTYILLGLEFMIVSDIIHTFLYPDLAGLHVLGLVVLIRSVISYFLEKEIGSRATRAGEPVRVARHGHV